MENKSICSTSPVDTAAAASSTLRCCGDTNLQQRIPESHSSITSSSAQPPCPEEEEEGYLRTGIVFEDGADHYDRHNRLHKERPARVQGIQDALAKRGLMSKCCCDVMELSSCQTFLSDDDYLRVHVPGYMQRLDRLAQCSCWEQLDREATQYKSVYLTPDSVDAAKKAAASLCSLASHVVKGDLDNGFAVIRPPGHHAEPGLAGGYCVINNVAVAAAYAKERLGVSKILIVDWDVHHGNGTQSIFLKDPHVLYFSVHRWHGGNFYPYLQQSGPTTVGDGAGAGYNVNVGWSRKEMGDDEYYAVWDHILLPIAKEYQPDLIFISAGFDAADGDLGECHVSPECFADLTRALKPIQSRMVAALEGGYVKSILGACVTHVVEALLERSINHQPRLDGNEKGLQPSSSSLSSSSVWDPVPLDEIDPVAAQNIRSTMEAHKPYWNCFSNK